MLRLLQNVEFFPSTFVRKKLGEIDEVVRRSGAARIGKRALTNLEVVVSYLDGAAKSGAHFARLYTEECGVRALDVVERAALRDKLAENDAVRVVLMVDDFVGTGQSAEKGLRELHDAVADIVRTRDIKVVFGAIVAFHSGWKHVQSVAEELQFGVETHCCEILEESSRLFGPQSKAFPDAGDRDRAREIARTRGTALEKSWPLGYGNLELAVVFERGSPNNTVPILWGESGQPKWIPLFKRV
jgi:hypothetical protein